MNMLTKELVKIMFVTDKQTNRQTGYPSIDKPWRKHYKTDDIDSSVTKTSVYRFLKSGNEFNLNNIAIRYFNHKIRYYELLSYIDECAGKLTYLGIGKGDVVTIQSLSMPQVTILFYALGKIGAVANIVYVTANEKEIHESLVQTKSKAYIAMDAIYEKNKKALDDTLVESILLLSLGEMADLITRLAINLKMKSKVYKSKDIYTWKAFMNLPSAEFEDNEDGSLPVALIYTSGTTGKSKAVVLTNEAMNSLAIQYKYADIGMKPGESFMNALPPFIAFGLVFSMHVPLCLGLMEIIVPDPTASKMGEQFAKYRPNYFVHGVSASESILENKKIQNMNLKFVKVLAAGGESVPIAFEKKVNKFLHEHNSDAQISIGYGMTEVAATVVTSSTNVYKEGTVGIPLPLTNIKIVEEGTINELGYNEEGEICFNAPTMMKEYFQNAEETNKVMRQHNDGLYWIHSGDMGKIDEDGFVTIVGRYKRMIPVRLGMVYHKVFPKLIEDVLGEIAGINAISIVGKETNDQQLHELVAYVVIEDKYDKEEMIAKLKETASTFEEWERPVQYIYIDSLPRTQVGKVDYLLLENMANGK